MRPFLRVGFDWGNNSTYNDLKQWGFWISFPRFSPSWKRLFKRPNEGEACLYFELMYKIPKYRIENMPRLDQAIDRPEAISRELTAEIIQQVSTAPGHFFENFRHVRTWQTFVENNTHRSVHQVFHDFQHGISNQQVKQLATHLVEMEISRYMDCEREYDNSRRAFEELRERTRREIDNERIREEANRPFIRVEANEPEGRERARDLQEIMNHAMRPGTDLTADVIEQILRMHGAEHFVENKKSIRNRRSVRIKALRQCKKALDEENYNRIKKLEPITFIRESGNPGYSIVFTVLDPKNKHSMIHYKGVAIECRCCIQVTDETIPCEEIALLKYLIVKHKEDYMWKTAIIHDLKVKPGFGNSEIDLKEMINIPLYELKILANKDGLREMTAAEAQMRQYAEMAQMAIPLRQQEEMNRMARQMGQAAAQQMGGLLGQILGGR